MDVDRVHIYNDPPSRDTLQQMIAAHPQGVAAFVSTRGRKYRELGLAQQELSDDEWLALMADEPRLLRRPILWNGEEVVVGWNRDAYEAVIGSGENS